MAQFDRRHALMGGEDWTSTGKVDLSSPGHSPNYGTAFQNYAKVDISDDKGKAAFSDYMGLCRKRTAPWSLVSHG